MIMNPADIEFSVDAWANGARSGAFNSAATSQDTPRLVDMSAANDRQPGILGFNR